MGFGVELVRFEMVHLPVWDFGPPGHEVLVET